MFRFSPGRPQTNSNATSILMSPLALEDSNNGMKCTSTAIFDFQWCINASATSQEKH